jgi:tRNA nucleotidyltransferase (CCA-adding enzyme)
MTHPVVTVDAARTVKEAEGAMTRYGVNALPVVRDGAYEGVVTRESIEKAIFHGFRASPVEQFMSTEVSTAQPLTPVREMEKTMIEQNQRFLPVLDGERIVGAITRTDLLRVLYEDYLRRTGVEHHEAEPRGDLVRNMSAWLRGKLPEKTYGILHHVGEVGSALGMGVYTVGGFVRDLLMGRQNGPETVEIDIDIVVEGDGIAFARALAERLGARMKSHERFGTAKLRMQGLALDVATARTEYYESPAALPTVEYSSIKKDLYRRDFTINTLALKLTPPEFGKLVDFFGGRRDIKEKTIRVLHDLSLVEDPTRAFRAVRFAERFGFTISRHTERLIASALDMQLFSRLSGARLHDELSLIFTEAEPTRAVERMGTLGLLAVIHPALKLDSGLRALLRSLHETLLWHRLSFIDEPIDRGRLFLMGLLSGLPGDELRAALARLTVPETVENRMLAEIALARETASAFPLPDPVRVWELLSRLTPEAVLFAMAVAGREDAKHQISHYLLVQRAVRPLLTGHDLKALGIPPGPIYSELLDGILRERLRGRLSSREDELAYVQKAHPLRS